MNFEKYFKKIVDKFKMIHIIGNVNNKEKRVAVVDLSRLWGEKRSVTATNRSFCLYQLAC